jgi:hypothetical protein
VEMNKNSCPLPITSRPFQDHQPIRGLENIADSCCRVALALAKGVIKSMYRYEKTNVNCQTRSVNPEPQTRYHLVGESWREIICTCERPP